MVPQVAIKVWDVAGRYGEEAFAQGVSDDAKSFASSLTQPYCGVNSGFEAVNWLDDTAMALSLALIPLRDGAANGTGPAFGMLVLPRRTLSASRAAWGRTSWSASPSWRAPRCRGCARNKR
jgi:uncharacterized protein YigA (DUF484 family)